MTFPRLAVQVDSDKGFGPTATHQADAAIARMPKDVRWSRLRPLNQTGHTREKPTDRTQE